jgi:DNA topoisomerase-1
MSELKTLIIVESPGKIKKISQYLGSEYIVKASIGHVQDLDKSTLSIDVSDNFKPYYITTPDKKKVLKELQSIAKECKDVILAADGDREGEAIASSLANVLKLKSPKRIIFHEITKSALLKALSNPTTINYDKVNAQQSRRILDRLVGYLISPILWKYLTNDAKSAGRVQSVVVKIIIDKENEIIQSVSKPFFKTIADFEFSNNDKTVNKFSATLYNGNKIYDFELEQNAITFLESISKQTEFRVISVKNTKSIKKPSPPFITSSLQQEASTKLRFNVKKTMDVAQKLYEAGLITYMRSDSPNISNDAIEEAKKYIIDTYGKEYSNPKNYTSKNTTSQDAHECIRPTHMNIQEPEDLASDQKRLYTLIWRRAIASQMANAQINIQTIQTDAINSKKSILLFNQIQTYFVSNLENVEFPGFLIVYDNTPQDESDEDKIQGKIEIKENNRLGMNKIKISEEYTKPPLRYNEAGLVKYLEKNGIGRPSTYASIISKVIERNYVEIKDIEGIKKQSKQIELSSKYNIKTNTKDVFIGKEQKKIVPTSMGNQVNEFLTNHFHNILDIEFTANFETYLDKISEGKANWVTVLRTFYDTFNPMVEKLNLEAKNIKQLGGNVADKLLGTDKDGCQVYTGTGKYGPYVKIELNDNNNKNKYRFAKLKEISIDKVTLDYALSLLEWPKTLGKISNALVTLNDGAYGLYIKCNNKNYSIKEALDPDDIDLEYAKKLISSGDPYSLKTFKIKDKVVNIKSGEFGPYLQIISGAKKQNISIPKKYNINNITPENVLEIIAQKNGTTITKKTFIKNN